LKPPLERGERGGDPFRTSIIPIRNSLVVTNPRAFVITLEQPGGIVVALAKTS
jgi:hypothetical protein